MGNIDEKFISTFTGLMIDKIKSLTEDWKQPWINLKASGGPQNIEGKRYKGINSLLLYLISEKNKYEFPAFLTFNQAKANGLNINKGEFSSPILYWNFSIRDKNTGEKIPAVQYEGLREEEKERYAVKPFMRHYNVFNVDQTNAREVKPELYRALKDRYKVEDLRDAKGMFVSEPLDNLLKDQSWIVPIYSLSQNQSYYTPGNASVEEKIVLPLKAQFNSGESFYSTMMHEMAHSTGKRLEREMPGTFGSDKYAKEELIAELTSAVSSASMGINKQIKEENALYLKNWLELIGENPKFLFGVLSDVNKASNMILEKVGNETQLDRNKIELGNASGFPAEMIDSQQELVKILVADTQIQRSEMTEYMGSLRNKEDIFSGDEYLLPPDLLKAYGKMQAACEEFESAKYSGLVCKEDLADIGDELITLHEAYKTAMRNAASQYESAGRTIYQPCEKGYKDWNGQLLDKRMMPERDEENRAEKSRISDIHIFSLKNGGMSIRCKIDGEQQTAEKLSREDLNILTDKTDRIELAAKYFAPVLSDNSRETNKALKM